MKNYRTIENNSNFIIINLFGLKIQIGKKHYCPICNTYEKFLNAGVNAQRKKVRCPVCDSLERHRYLYFVYLFHFLNDGNKQINLLHMAPEKCFHNLLSDKQNINYTCMDLYPENYDYAPECKKEDVLNMSFRDNSFDIVLSNHILEHIKNEKKFFEEIMRVLKPNGKLILSVPYSKELKKTFEDPNIDTDEDRLKYYGQKDHVRIYGRDIFETLGKYAQTVGGGQAMNFSRNLLPDKFAQEIHCNYDDDKSDDAIIIFTKRTGD